MYHALKMPTIVGILTFISMINTASEILKSRKVNVFKHLSFSQSSIKNNLGGQTETYGMHDQHAVCALCQESDSSEASMYMYFDLVLSFCHSNQDQSVTLLLVSLRFVENKFITVLSVLLIHNCIAVNTK